MKALVRKSLEKEHFEYEEVDKPAFGSNEALIRIRAVGVCGTDYHMWTGTVDTMVPLIPGHELCGEVEAIGSDVKNVKPGDRVVSRLNIGVCGICRACLTGNPHMCADRQCPGFKVPGAYAEYIAIESKQLVKIGEQVSFEEGALIEPTAIVAHGLLERTVIEPEDAVVVFGPGPIGIIAAQMSRTYGASEVAIVGTTRSSKTRMPIAKKMGFTNLYNSQTEDIEAEIMKLTDGKGVDLVIESSGSEMSINTGFKILRKQGKMCVLGLPATHESKIDWLLAAEKSLNVIFSYSSSPWSWNIAISLLNRRGINVADLITHAYPLSRYKDMFAEMDKGNVVKGVFLP